MSEWKEYKLGELIENNIADLQTGPFGTMLKASEYVEDGIPVIAVQDIGENKFHTKKLNYISEDTARRLKKYRVEQDDIIFCRKGAVDRRAIVSQNEHGWLQGSDCIRLRLKNSIDSRFISYQLGSSFIKEWLHQHSNGATMPSLNQEILSLLPLFIPSLDEQKAIVSILASLDEKIDLLNQENKTLESMAEMLFQQSFIVDADEEWDVTNLGEIVSIYSGTTPSTANHDFWDGDIFWTTPRDITNLRGLYLFDTERKITTKGLEQIGSGLLPTGALLMSSRAPVGALAFSEIPVAINQGYAGIVCDKGFSREFVYLWLKQNMDFVQSHANGSTFQEISKSVFRSLEIQIPQRTVLVEFQNIVYPLFNKIKSNELQIRKLSDFRDKLLPKLMSGELRVL